MSKFSKNGGRSKRLGPRRSSSGSQASGGGTAGGAASMKSTPSRSRPYVALTSSPGPGIVVDDSWARTCATAAPRRNTSTRTSSGPEGTGEQKCVLAESGRSPGSPTSSCIARIATVIRTPPEGVRKFQASGRLAVYHPGAALRRVTAVSSARSCMYRMSRPLWLPGVDCSTQNLETTNTGL